MKGPFSGIRNALKKIRILFFVLLQILLVAIPCYKWVVATTPKGQIANLCGFIVAIVVVIFNIVIECIQERKKKKQTKKVKKKVRKILKIISRVITLAFLIVQFFFTETPHPVVSYTLIGAVLAVIGDIIYLIASFTKKTLRDGVKEDTERLISTVKAKCKSAIDWVRGRLPKKKTKQKEPEAISGPKEVKPTPVKKKIFPLHHETPVAEAPKPIIQETELSPKKRFSFPPFFKKKTEDVAEETAEEVCEALPAPEVEEAEAPVPAKRKNPLLAFLPKKKASEGEPEAETTVTEEIAEALPAPEVEEAEVPAPEKKKNPLLAFLPKKKGKAPEDVHTEEGAPEETLIK